MVLFLLVVVGVAVLRKWRLDHLDRQLGYGATPM
jgi:hypothetical protein